MLQKPMVWVDVTETGFHTTGGTDEQGRQIEKGRGTGRVTVLYGNTLDLTLRLTNENIVFDEIPVGFGKTDSPFRVSRVNDREALVQQLQPADPKVDQTFDYRLNVVIFASSPDPTIVNKGQGPGGGER